MGTRGPAPPQKSLVVKKGYYQPSRHGDDIGDSDKLKFVHNELPTPPEDLSEKGKEIWITQLSQALKLYGYISFIDLSMFKEYCYVYGEMEYLKEHTKGRTYTDDKGTIRLDPLYMELNKLRKDFIRLSQEFGFSPSARTRITLQNKPDENTDIYGDGI